MEYRRQDRKAAGAALTTALNANQTYISEQLLTRNIKQNRNINETKSSYNSTQ